MSDGARLIPKYVPADVQAGSRSMCIRVLGGNLIFMFAGVGTGCGVANSKQAGRQKKGKV